MLNNRTDSAQSGLTLDLDPVENFIFAGVRKHVGEVVGGKTIWVTSNDKTKALQRLFGNVAAGAQDIKVVYPYCFLKLGNFQITTERWNSMALNLYGIKGAVFVDDQKRSYRVKLLPADIQVNLEYVTNSFMQARDMGKRFLFARHNGWLAFNVQYGRSTLEITCDLASDIQLPDREADLGSVQEYVVSVSFTIRGFLSDSTLLEEQIVDNVVVTAELQSKPGQTVWAFNLQDEAAQDAVGYGG